MKNTLLQEALTSAEIYERRLRVSVRDPGQLIRWLEESGRKWMVLSSLDLVRALPWPEGVDDLLRVLASYREYRLQQSSGRTERQMDPTLGLEVEVPVVKGELLEIEELDRAIRYLIGQITERDPTWTLESPPL